MAALLVSRDEATAIEDGWIRTLTRVSPDLRDRIQIFELDHPVTQRLKQQRMRDAGLADPANVHYVPLDCPRSPIASMLAHFMLKAVARTTNGQL